MGASRWRIVTLVLLVLAAFVAGSWPTPAKAQAPPSKLALVIAVGDYEGTEWPKLTNPTADAALIRSSLEAAGFKLARPAVNLRRPQLVQRLEEFRRAAELLPANSIALIYYSGHGIQVDGQNYLVPLGTRSLARVESLAGTERERVLSEEFVPLNEVLNAFSRTRREQPGMANVLILDACRVNPLDGRTRAAGRPKGLADVSVVDNTLIAFAAAPGTVAYDGAGKTSPYAEALAGELKQTNLPLSLLFTRVRARTMALTDGMQRPQYWDALSDIFCLDRCGDTKTASIAYVPKAAGRSGPISLQRSATVPECPFCPELVQLHVGKNNLNVTRLPVSLAEWRKCVDESSCSPLGDPKDDGDLPAVGVSWSAAQAYADWLSDRTGKRWRLPTQEEWASLFAPFKGEPRRKQRRLPAMKNETGKGLAYVGKILEWTSGCRDAACSERVAMGVTFDDDFSDLLEGYGFAADASGDALGFRLVREQ